MKRCRSCASTDALKISRGLCVDCWTAKRAEAIDRMRFKIAKWHTYAEQYDDRAAKCRRTAMRWKLKLEVFERMEVR